jgi:hypothetical protein
MATKCCGRFFTKQRHVANLVHTCTTHCSLTSLPTTQMVVARMRSWQEGVFARFMTLCHYDSLAPYIVWCCRAKTID